MIHKNIWKSLALLVLILAGCATTVRIEVERPPTLNTSDIRRIAIMPFEAASGGNSYREIAQYATSIAKARIQAMNYFTLVDHSVIQNLQRNNQSIEDYVDALFIGRITLVHTAANSQQRSYRDRNGNTINYTDYTTDVEINFNYSLVRARDGSLIGPVSRGGNNSQTSQERFPAAEPMLRGIVDSQLVYLNRDLAPHTVIENRTMVKDSSRDKALQAEMKDALALVKGGSYRAALDAYIGINQRYGSIAAAENAAILYEALGETHVAANLMERIFLETGNPRARNAHARLSRILQDRETIASEYGDNRRGSRQTERVAVFASEEIQKVLPKNANVWIYNNSSANAMAEAVVDDITADFIRKGIGIVDRQNATLIEAEQRFHVSGNVSDNDFVSIGNAAGANTIAVIGITGTGAMRRLQVRVLDIERGIPIMQSDTSENWRL